MLVKFKKLHKNAVIPSYAHDGDSGFDFYSVEDVEIDHMETVLVKTGLSLVLPMGTELQVRPRSGVSLKTNLRVANSPGTVDSSYRGEICVIVQNLGNPTTIAAGTRIAQGVICPVIRAIIQEVNEVEETERGANGFGSTGT